MADLLEDVLDDLPLDELIKVTQSSVVQSVDAGSLQRTVKWIVHKLKQQPRGGGDAAGAAGGLDLGPVAEQLGRLAKENEALKEQLQKLQERQASWWCPAGVVVLCCVVQPARLACLGRSRSPW